MGPRLRADGGFDVLGWDGTPIPGSAQELHTTTRLVHSYALGHALAGRRQLADWHPLISGDPESVHRAGVSIRGQTINEMTLDEPEDALNFEAPEWMAERGAGQGRRR